MAAKIPGLVLAEDEVSQTINLEEIFGVDLSRSESLKQQLGQAIIDRMIERTENGKSVSGGNLGSYDPAYIASKKFELYGKSAGDVNMTLTGRTLNSVDIESSSGNELKIAVAESRAPQSYNQNVGDTQKKRQWFGVNKSELSDIKADFSSELKQVKEGKKEAEDKLKSLDLATIRALGGSTTNDIVKTGTRTLGEIDQAIGDDFYKFFDLIVDG